MQPRLLPIVHVLFHAIVMYGVAYWTDTIGFMFEVHGSTAAVIFIVGVIVVLVGGYQFRVAGTTVHPLKPETSTQLVTNGIYRLSRNPMYVGFFMFLLAWAIILDSLYAYLILPVFVLLITRVQILPEERVLQEKFGEDYLRYKRRVRRWI